MAKAGARCGATGWLAGLVGRSKTRSARLRRSLAARCLLAAAHQAADLGPQTATGLRRLRRASSLVCPMAPGNSTPSWPKGARYGLLWPMKKNQDLVGHCCLAILSCVTALFSALFSLMNDPYRQICQLFAACRGRAAPLCHASATAQLALWLAPGRAAR